MRGLTSQVALEPLQRLLEGIHEGDIALPEFQREFLWDDAAVGSLLATIFRGWPAGSLLLMEGEPRLFAVRGFDGGPEAAPPLRYVVLDGQQRLTAAYQAFFDSGPYVYAIDLARVPGFAEALFSDTPDTDVDWDPEDVEQAIVSYKRADWDRRYRFASQAPGIFLLPIYALRDPADFFEWRDRVAGSTLIPPAEVLADRLTAFYRAMLGGVEAYAFPAVVLDPSVEPAAIARIFERLNRTGLRLNAFDLVVARTYQPDWNLRRELDRLRAEHALLDRFLAEDGMPLLQVLALHSAGDVRQSAVLQLPAELVRARWSEVAAAADEALLFLVENCGVCDAAWLPYRSILIVLAALALEVPLEAHREELKRWFWNVSFGSAFDVAANTRVVAEYYGLTDRVGGEPADDYPALSASTLWYATRRRNGALWRAFLCVLATRTPHDPTGVDLALSPEYLRVEGFPGHAVISRLAPASTARSTDGDPLHLRVLNAILLLRTTEARRPSMSWVSLLNPQDPRTDPALESQFLPPRDFIVESVDDWERVLWWRLERLLEHLETGAGVAVIRDAEPPPSVAIARGRGQAFEERLAATLSGYELRRDVRSGRGSIDFVGRIGDKTVAIEAIEVSPRTTLPRVREASEQLTRYSQAQGGSAPELLIVTPRAVALDDPTAVAPGVKVMSLEELAAFLEDARQAGENEASGL